MRCMLVHIQVFNKYYIWHSKNNDSLKPPFKEIIASSPCKARRAKRMPALRTSTPKKMMETFVRKKYVNSKSCGIVETSCNLRKNNMIWLQYSISSWTWCLVGLVLPSKCPCSLFWCKRYFGRPSKSSYATEPTGILYWIVDSWWPVPPSLSCE